MAKRGESNSSKGKSGGSRLLDDSVRMLILCGTENYLRTEKLRALREAIEATRGEVDVLHFDGLTATAADVLDEARSLGLMQQYKIVVVDEADEFIKRGDHRRSMERYAESPVDSVTLVLRSAKWNPGNLDKMVAKIGLVVKCDELDIPTAVAFCIRRCAKRYGCTIDARSANLLVTRIGTSLARLDTELARLSLMTETVGGVIDSALVEDQIQLSREEKAWEVQEALLTGDGAAALGKVNDLMTVSRLAPEPIFYFMTDLSRKIYAARRMLDAGQSEGAIRSQLKLWGASANPLLAAARRASGPALAELEQDCLRALHRPRTSLGDPNRAVETLAVRFLSVLGPGRR